MATIMGAAELTLRPLRRSLLLGLTLLGLTNPWGHLYVAHQSHTPVFLHTQCPLSVAQVQRRPTLASWHAEIWW